MVLLSHFFLRLCLVVGLLRSVVDDCSEHQNTRDRKVQSGEEAMCQTGAHEATFTCCVGGGLMLRRRVKIAGGEVVVTQSVLPCTVMGRVW